MPDLGARLEDHADGSWTTEKISQIGGEGYTSSEVGGDAGSRAAALQAFAGFRRTVRNHAKFGLSSSSKPEADLERILQAADRCPTSPTNATSWHCASCKWAKAGTPSLQGAVHSAPPAHSLSAQLNFAV